MREHALPQDVTSYKFHIIGNMTLKQFAEAAAGVALSFIVYLTNLPTLIKWPIMAVFTGAGLIAAFLPIAERPLDQWLVAFFKALYRPTLFFWKRTSQIPEPFLFKANEQISTLVADIDLTPARRKRVKEFLHSVQVTIPKDTLEKYTDQRLNEVMSIFGPDQAGNALPTANAAPAYSYAAPAIPPETVDSANLSVPEQTAPQLAASDSGGLTATAFFNASDYGAAAQPTSPAPTNSASMATSEPQAVSVPQAPPPQVASTINPSTDLPAPVTVFASDDVTTPTPATPPTPLQPTLAAASGVNTSTNQKDTNVAVPQTAKISITPVTQNGPPSTNTAAAPAPVSTDASAYTTLQGRENTTSQPTAAATTNANLPFPSAPNEPNKVVGMVIDANSTPLPNAIVEIRTPEGLPARAVKTNPLGQFFITTPLANGNYVVVVEKEGLQFAPLTLELTGQVVLPLQVQAEAGLSAHSAAA